MPVVTPTSTTWTGLAGNGLWSDPDNWTNGVPVTGAAFTSINDDIATIDNSISTTPFTLTIDGSSDGSAAVGAMVSVNLTDPLDGPSVILTGTLDLSTNVTPTSGTLGQLNLQNG